MMLRMMLFIGLLFITPSAYAQLGGSSDEEEPETLYMRVKDLVEKESGGDNTELAIQRFSVGVFHDEEIKTNIEPVGIVPFLIPKEEYADWSLQQNYTDMCGDPSLRNDYGTCLLAQENIREMIDRNAWHRKLGRELQTIASGYEIGIDGYPGKHIDVISRMGSITHLWRAANDPFVQPILEELTRARPWPEGLEDAIEETADGVVERLKQMIITWTPEGGDEEDEKQDDTAMVAAVHRYRHGVQYVIDREGECEDAPDTPDNPANVWLERRWCELEDDLLALLDIIQMDDVELGNDEHIIYPSIVDEDENIYVWIRSDDVGLQWYIPLEPVQAALYPPEYGDCLDGGSPAECYLAFETELVRGGNYPAKLSGANARISLGIEFDTDVFTVVAEGDFTLPNGDPDDGSVVTEPEEGDGICSHPFSKRGYLCRSIESENCNLSAEQEEALADSGTGGIVLTGCQPESFIDDIARKASGPNICSVGGWREEVEENNVEDTPEKQPDMVPSECSQCAIDVVCAPEGCDGDTFKGFTAREKRNGVIEICVPEEAAVPGFSYYILMHELIHAQQMCGQSDLQTYEYAGSLEEDDEEKAAACCALEREAYFGMCKLMAAEGLLEQAKIPIDQCANALANFSCDEDLSDDENVCTNDGIDPADVFAKILESVGDLSGELGVPATCSEALEDPRAKAIYNSMPMSCSPGCQAKYANTIGNNLCYAGQCLEETHEYARAHPGRMGLTAIDEDFPWDACEQPEPDIGNFAVPPALTGPTFPLYNPALVMQELDRALCQINGLPAKTPPIVCAFDPIKRLDLPPLTLGQSVEDLILQPEQYDTTGLGIQFAAQGIGARISGEMFANYLRPRARQFTDLLNMTYHLFNGVGDIAFPGTMCPRYTDDSFSCSTLQR